MKASGLCAMMASAVISAASASAAITNNPDHFFCEFGSEDAFNAWTAVDVNGTNGSGSDIANCWTYDAAHTAVLLRCGSADADDWLFSPKVKLSGGKDYVIKINMVADWPCLVQVTMGPDATPASQQTLSDVETLDGSYYQSYRLPSGVAAGEYCFGIHNTTKASQDGWLFVKSVEVVDDRDGSIVFSLVNNGTGKAIEGVELNLSGPTYIPRAVKTDQSGTATFSSLTPGTYTVSYDILGLINTDPVKIEVGDRADVKHTLKAALLPVISVSGVVTDHLGQPCADAEVVLKGSVQNYSVTTGADGRFQIADVFGDSEYDMTVSKYRKGDYRTTVTFGDKDRELSAITLEPYFGQPSGIAADPVENGMYVSWMAPIGRKVVSHDNGIYAGMYAMSGYEYANYGVKFDEPMTVEEIKWVVAELKDGKVDLGIYLIDRNGNISTTPAFFRQGVESDTYRWTDNMDWQTYVLDEPVDAPYGCIISVGHDLTSSGMSICTDYAGECYTSMVSASRNGENGWAAVPSYLGGFFIRAKGVIMSRNVTMRQNSYKVASRQAVMHAPAAETIEGVSYDVWRLSGNDLDNSGAWVSVASGVRGLYAIDNDFTALPQGVYRYAVQAVSDAGKKSEIAFSRELAHKLTTDLYLAVFSNTALELADGAAVTLKSESPDGASFADVVTDNRVVFTGIPKDVYTLTIEKYGYSTISQSVDLSSESNYVATTELLLTPLAPFSLSASQNEGTQDVTLTWNKEDGIFEDFESMEDFAINPAGDLGWTYADVDQGVTYGVNMCQQTPYANMHSPMAFQAFNPSATTPDITEFVRPYSGKKVLVDVSQESGAQNDDYLFSPELSFDAPFIMRFQASSGFFALMGNERFMVGYTTDAPEPENVTWITQTPVSVGGVWTEYAYTMPAQARHAVIRCISKDCMFFMLDDIFIGRVEADVFAMTSYKIEIDGEDAGVTTGRSFVVKGLDKGKHLAKVQTVYTMADATNQYSDFTELVFNVSDQSSLDEIVAESLYSYDRQARRLTAGQGVASMEVYDVHGRLVGAGAVVDLDGVASGVLVVTVTTADGRAISGKILL